jgi:hypothetical protein
MVVFRAGRVLIALVQPVLRFGEALWNVRIIVNLTATFVTHVPASIPAGMDQDPVSKYLSEIGKKGARARAKRLTSEQRKQIASKAGKESGKVRRKKAKERKTREKRWS